MRRILPPHGAFLGGVYRFDERVLRGTFLGVLRLRTISVAGVGEERVPSSVKRLLLPSALRVA